MVIMISSCTEVAKGASRGARPSGEAFLPAQHKCNILFQNSTYADDTDDDDNEDDENDCALQK